MSGPARDEVKGKEQNSLHRELSVDAPKVFTVPILDTSLFVFFLTYYSTHKHTMTENSRKSAATRLIADVHDDDDADDDRQSQPKQKKSKHRDTLTNNSTNADWTTPTAQPNEN